MAPCGFFGGYLPVESIDELVGLAGKFFPDFCQVIDLETSIEGRPIRAIKLGKGSGATRRGVLFVGGVHARELINPDALMYFAFRLATSYKENQDFIVGAQTYTADFVRALIENMDIFILPLANPDGRAFVLAKDGDRMWRRSRAPNPGLPCKGVVSIAISTSCGAAVTAVRIALVAKLIKAPRPFQSPKREMFVARLMHSRTLSV